MSVTINTTLGPVVLKECFEGYEAGIELTRGPYIQKMYLCPSWSGSFACVNSLMGLGTPPTGRHQCPESPNLRCINAALVPRAEADFRNSGRPEFNMPLIKATYQVPTWEELVSDDPQGNQSFGNEINPGQPYVFMEQSIDFDTEVVKLPGRTYGFSDGVVNDTPVAVSVGVADFVLIRRWQTTLPYVNFTKYMNKLNTSTFLGQPRGQIKFRKGRTRRVFSDDGTRTQEVELHFKWREADHNNVIRPDNGLFDTLFVGANIAGATPYKYADLTVLLS